MNNDEARILLQAYRPGEDDREDPVFREALEQAEVNREMACWFSREQDFDSRIRAKFTRAISPPAHLRPMLLASRKAAPKVAWWRTPMVRFAAAACFAILLAGSSIWMRRGRSLDFANYRQAMSALALKRLNPPELVSHNIADVKHWLALLDSKQELTIPKAPNGKPDLNCRTLEWKGKQIVFICFETENKVVHLLVTDRAALKDPPSDALHFYKEGALATLSWSHKNKTYLAVSKDASENDLRMLF
jgi:hypothetical protein